MTEITKLVYEGRKDAYMRMLEEAKQSGGAGLAGVSFDLVNHGSNLEFIALGSAVRRQAAQESEALSFSTSASGQELYCQVDAGFTPRTFVFGNVAYSIGVGGSIGGAFRGLKRGEVPQYTKIFDQTRHLALSRVKENARRVKANAVIGIETSIMPLLGAQEMLMMGTASSHPALAGYQDDPATSDLTNEELWNVVNLGYLPISLVMGVSVYALGLASGVASIAKSLLGGNVQTLTELLYEAREKALERVEIAAEQAGADEVVGAKTRIYDLGGGLVEFMVIGTAVKKFPNVSTVRPDLIPQAVIQDRETFVEARNETRLSQPNATSARRTQKGPLTILVTLLIFAFYVLKALVIRHIAHHAR